MKTTDTNMRKLVQKLGEDTIYSAKGHFKACDIRRICVTTTIWVCAIINVLGITISSPILCKVLSAVSLFGMIALLIWDSAANKEYCSNHKQMAEKYLALHKDLRAVFYLASLSKEKIEELNYQVNEINQSCKLDIPLFARRLAKKAIEKKDSEVDKWFFDQQMVI